MRFLIFITIVLSLTACVTPQPDRVDNVCAIFRQYPKWFWASKDVRKEFGIPIDVQMAIVHQESRFVADAKPPRGRLLWIIPWFRPTSAYGYAQAIDGTWAHYKRMSGNNGADRDDFKDAVHFIGWYASQVHRRYGVPRTDVYHLYLAYHEGMVGYKEKTYRKKIWLQRVAKKVRYRANVYRGQLAACEASLPTKPWWRFW